MMNNWLLLLFFLLIPQFLIDILLLQLLLLVQLHNVRRIHRDTNKLFSSQAKKPVISQTGSKIANDHQIPQEVYHGRTLTKPQTRPGSGSVSYYFEETWGPRFWVWGLVLVFFLD